MSAAANKLRAASPEVRTATVALLDELSRPLTPRELDKAFAASGLTRAQSRRATLALKHLDIIAMAPWPGP